MPLVAELIELVGAIGAAEGSGELGHDVVLAFENDSPRAFGVGDDALADLEAGCSERVGRDRDLMLRADASGSSAAILYFGHSCKGISEGRAPLRPSEATRVPNARAVMDSTPSSVEFS